jgi:hypothetical protein
LAVVDTTQVAHYGTTVVSQQARQEQHKYQAKQTMAVLAVVQLAQVVAVVVARLEAQELHLQAVQVVPHLTRQHGAEKQH